jgi:hypothetical protein
MRPETAALRLLSVTRAKAKMYEYEVPAEEHIALPQRPEQLFSLAVGLLGDAAAAIATGETVVAREETTAETLAFAARYFEAYIETRLNETVEVDFSIFGAAAYYLADNPGSATVVVRGTAPPPPTLGSGLALLAYRLLLSDYIPLVAAVYGELPDQILSGLSAYLEGSGTAESAMSPMLRIRDEAYRTGDGRELLYADISTALVKKKIANAARTILPGASGLALEVWLPTLQRAAFPRELWPSQQRICSAGVLEGTSAVIQMPTSAGKTVLSQIFSVGEEGPG